MRTIYGDTSFFVALLNPKDELHPVAQRLRAILRQFHLVTSEMVLAELLNDFGARGSALRRAACGFVERLRQNGHAKPASVTILAQTRELFDAALAAYSDRMDKSWSLTDCASYIQMRDHRIRDVLTYHQHFVQMGFNALLR